MLASMPRSRAIAADLTRDPAVALPTSKPVSPLESVDSRTSLPPALAANEGWGPDNKSSPWPGDRGFSRGASSLRRASRRQLLILIDGRHACPVRQYGLSFCLSRSTVSAPKPAPVENRTTRSSKTQVFRAASGMELPATSFAKSGIARAKARPGRELTKRGSQRGANLALARRSSLKSE
jgi:hypothetical protein